MDFGAHSALANGISLCAGTLNKSSLVRPQRLVLAFACQIDPRSKQLIRAGYALRQRLLAARDRAACIHRRCEPTFREFTKCLQARNAHFAQLRDGHGESFIVVFPNVLVLQFSLR
jgi:hypothetical protein